MAMNIAPEIIRLLKFCGARAKNDEEKAQVDWWMARVSELRSQQPDASPRQLEFVAHPATGTEGPH